MPRHVISDGVAQASKRSARQFRPDQGHCVCVWYWRGGDFLWQQFPAGTHRHREPQVHRTLDGRGACQVATTVRKSKHPWSAVPHAARLPWPLGGFTAQHLQPCLPTVGHPHATHCSLPAGCVRACVYICTCIAGIPEFGQIPHSSRPDVEARGGGPYLFSSGRALPTAVAEHCGGGMADPPRLSGLSGDPVGWSDGAGVVFLGSIHSPEQT